ncbi:hypothetical protein QF034_000137 [Streptomyces africanus]|uniref:Transposase IS701-like DDE domain-containing protein n=1 Tax=Streptomyces africanus TaxID=231024 RepID=A0ABU0QET6_9ACTN|nr:hypothetical protein [Streptomyces africanus]
MVPGWPCSVVAALETGRTSWTAVLDAVRLEPGADVAAVTTVQIREVIERLVAADQWRPGDPEVLIVLDAGYDAPRITHLLAGLPVEILGRLRSDRVMRRPTPSRKRVNLANPKGGRPPKHGGEFVFGGPATWGTEQAVTTMNTRLHGKATAQAWDRLHPRLTRRAAWLDHDGPPPLIEGTSSAWSWRNCRPVESTSRSGCGGQALAPPKRTSTAAGSPSSAASTSSTPFACSNRPSAGPSPGSAARKQPTGGHGW